MINETSRPDLLILFLLPKKLTHFSMSSLDFNTHGDFGHLLNVKILCVPGFLNDCTNRTLHQQSVRPMDFISCDPKINFYYIKLLRVSFSHALEQLSLP